MRQPRTYVEFHQATPDLTGPDRREAFHLLPDDARAEIEANEAARWRSIRRREQAQENLGHLYTLPELETEIARLAVAEGEQPEPTRTRRPTLHLVVGARSKREPVNLSRLRQHPSSEYIPRLTGRELQHAGYLTCPFHADGNENTPSLHTSDDDGKWYCQGCHRGGGAIEFYAALHDRTVPTDNVEFIQLAREVERAVIR